MISYYIDLFLNRITAYRLMFYYLVILVVFAALFGLFDILPYTPKDLFFNSLIALGAGFISNYLFAKIFKAQTNIESVFITSLILVLIMPVSFPKDSVLLAFVLVIAMASKYLFAFKKRHIFNPAAIAAVIMSYFGYAASWWIGSFVMLPFILLGGFLVLRKTQREKLSGVFLAVFLLVAGIGTFFTNGSLETVFMSWRISVLDSSLLFFMFVMLIEPLTSPAGKKAQIYFAIIIAIIYSLTQVGIVNLAITPEMALISGNLFFYLLFPNYRLILKLKDKLKLSSDTFMFIFEKQKNFNFIPGQYLEWTLPHKKTDSRGVRRYFSLSSSPTENNLSITVKFYDSSSSYKKELVKLSDGKQIIASQLAGDFVLPENLNVPLVFISGGVGITPFRSMIKYIVDKNFNVDIVLIYINKTKEEILFSDIFKTAQKNGVKTEFFLTEEKGYLNKDGIIKLVPDYQKRKFYVSGPQLMVQNFQTILLKAGIKKNKIKMDFFPGYSETK